MQSLVTLTRALAGSCLDWAQEKWEERKQDKKYRQFFRRSFIIKGMREMKQFLEGEMESREKWKK